jgi:hypothetical protein
LNERPHSERPDWLRLKRGRVDFLIPAAWVRRVDEIARPVLLPQAESWVIGLALADGGRWLPVLDPLTAAGGTAPRHGVAALLATPSGALLGWCLADGPGVLEPRPADLSTPHAALPWLRSLTPGPHHHHTVWLFDVPAWSESLSAT